MLFEKHRLLREGRLELLIEGSKENEEPMLTDPVGA
jgi:hypothetical protein